ncbi:MAG: alpha-ribazole phosphatase [Candidatus Parcubacteria bacterium]|nr:MAG: alpha-ribazole phosphatase [Candidatus Parcubacteria bacterium]
MKVYFVTHSTTVDNEKNIVSGWNDVELSEIGKEQAKEITKRFENFNLDLICCSDLKRAVETVKIAFNDRYSVIIDKRLREINYGDFNGKEKTFIDSIKFNYIEKPFPNGESFKDAIERVIDFYRGLKEKYNDKIILIVGHRTTHYGLEILVNKKSIEECLKEPFQWQPYWKYEF